MSQASCRAAAMLYFITVLGIPFRVGMVFIFQMRKTQAQHTQQVGTPDPSSESVLLRPVAKLAPCDKTKEPEGSWRKCPASPPL